MSRRRITQAEAAEATDGSGWGWSRDGEPATSAEAGSQPAAGSPILTRLADVRPEPVSWLWPGRIALGKLTLIAGDPGLGKSFLTLDLAARVSRGAPWPDARVVAQPAGGVVLLSAEDDVADTIRPRLDAAGADVRRIVALQAIRGGRGGERMFDLAGDLPALEDAIASEAGCRLVVIDPVTAYLGGTDSHNNADVRGLLAPLGQLAAAHRLAVVAVTHLNKSAGGAAIYRTMGSLAFAAAARAAWAVVKDDADPRRRLLLPIKNNLAPDTGGLAYSIAEGDGGPVVAWEDGRVDVTADDALTPERGKPGPDAEALDDAKAWLSALLADGPKPAREVDREAREAGHSMGTVRRAKVALKVESRKPAWGGAWSGRSPPAKARSLRSRSTLRTCAPSAPMPTTGLLSLPQGPMRPKVRRLLGRAPLLSRSMSGSG
jgi:putative DNA primase/helicase